MNQSSTIYHIPLDRINFGLYNRRSNVDTSCPDIQELAEDIAANGQLVPGILVAPYEYRMHRIEDVLRNIALPDPIKHKFLPCLVVGHRRWLALLSIQAHTGKPQTIAVTYWQDATESAIRRAIFSENAQRKSFLPSEEAKLEVEIRHHMEQEGLVSTRAHPDPEKPSYARVRAAETGVSERTIEQRVRLGMATPALLNAADIGTVTKSGAFSLAAFDPSTQVHTLSYLEGEGISHANPQEVAAAVNAVRQRQGLPAVKHGEEYAPSEATKTLGGQLQRLTEQVAMCKFSLEYYADGLKDPALARQTLEKLEGV